MKPLEPHPARPVSSAPPNRWNQGHLVPIRQRCFGRGEGPVHGNDRSRRKGGEGLSFLPEGLEEVRDRRGFRELESKLAGSHLLPVGGKEENTKAHADPKKKEGSVPSLKE